MNKKYLFASDVNLADIYTFAIGSNGALEKVSETDTEKIPGGGCENYERPKIDYTGFNLIQRPRLWECQLLHSGLQDRRKRSAAISGKQPGQHSALTSCRSTRLHQPVSKKLRARPTPSPKHRALFVGWQAGRCRGWHLPAAISRSSMKRDALAKIQATKGRFCPAVCRGGYIVGQSGGAVSGV